MKFTHETWPQRVRFATGEASQAVADEIAVLGGTRVMVIGSSPEQVLAEPVAPGTVVVARHDEVVMHVPVEVAGRARDAAVTSGADVIVSVGGGSTTGLAKAVAKATGLPIIAVPTTYAGSEATNVWGLTEDGTKTTGVDDRVLPRSIVYDASLLTTLPAEMSIASGLNALAHCVDSMWGPHVDPIDQALAQEGISGLGEGLPQVASHPAGLSGIEQTLYGAYLGAVSFASAGSGLHHKICHVLGGMFNLPHAQTHAVVLPHVLAFNAPNAPHAERRIAQAFRSPTAVEGLAALRHEVHAPKALKDYGLTEESLPLAVAPILAALPPNNPTPVNEENLTALLRAAWAGDDE